MRGSAATSATVGKKRGRIRSGAGATKPDANEQACRNHRNTESSPDCTCTSTPRMSTSSGTTPHKMKSKLDLNIHVDASLVDSNATPTTVDMNSPAETISVTHVISPDTEIPLSAAPAATAAEEANLPFSSRSSEPVDLRDALHNLEEKWLAQRPKTPEDEKRINQLTAVANAAQSPDTASTTRRANATTGTGSGRKRTRRQVGKPSLQTDAFSPSTSIPGVIDVCVKDGGAVESGATDDDLLISPRRRKHMSVFERLSQQSTASSRRKQIGATTNDTFDSRSMKSFVSTPRSRRTMGGKGPFESNSIVSTLSCADSVFDRLYRNERRPKRHPHVTPGSADTCATPISEISADVNDARRTKVERRLTYTPSSPKRRAKQGGKKKTKTSRSRNDEHGTNSSSDRVFDRLYNDGRRIQNNRARSEVESTTDSISIVHEYDLLMLAEREGDQETIVSISQQQDDVNNHVPTLRLPHDEISCIEEVVSADADDDTDEDRMKDAKQLIEESFDLIEKFMATTNQLVTDSVTEVLEEAEIVAAKEDDGGAAGDEQAFAEIDEAIDRLGKAKTKGYCPTGTSVPSLVQTALSSRKHCKPKLDLVSQYYLRERCGMNEHSALQQLWSDTDERGTDGVGAATRVNENLQPDEIDISLNRAALVIQRQYRCYRAMLSYRFAVVRVQAWLRGVAVSRCLRKRAKAVLTIQCIWRGHQGRIIAADETQRSVAAARRIQGCYRMRKARTIFQTKVRVVILLQAFARRFIARQLFRRKVNAATSLQNVWRMQVAMKKIVLTKIAVLRIQSSWRSYYALRAYTTSMQVPSVVILQSAIRSYLAMVAYKTSKVKRLSAICIIQSLARGFLAQKKLAALESSRSVNKRRNLIRVQSFVRMIIVRRRLLRENDAARCIQVYYQAWKMHQMLIALRIRLLEHRLLEEKRAEMENCALIIQSIARGYLVRREIQRYCQNLHHVAAVTIQQCWHAHISRRDRTYRTRAVLILQSTTRRHLCQKHYTLLLNSTFRVQPIARGYLVRKEARMLQLAAITIQRHWRGFEARCVRLWHLRAIVAIQSSIRRDLCQRHLSLYLRSAVILQAFARGHLKRQQLKEKRAASKRRAAVAIQRCWRGNISRRDIGIHLKAILVIQSLVRRHHCRKQYSLIRKNAVHMQALVRGCLLRMALEKHTLSALMIQRAWRNYCSASHSQLVTVVVKIQKTFRGYSSWKVYNTKIVAVIAIQSLARGRRCRAKVFSILNAALCIQRAYRRFTAAKAHASAIRIQPVYRSHRERTELTNTLRSISFLQAWWRMAKERARYISVLKSATKLQAVARQLVAKKSYAESRSFVIRIQRKWRAHCLKIERAAERRRKFLEKAAREQEVLSQVRAQVDHDVAIISGGAADLETFGPCVRKLALQLYASRARAASLRSLDSSVQRASTEHVTSVIKIQSASRPYRASSTYNSQRSALVRFQACVRAVLARKRIRVTAQAAVVIQTRYRCYRGMQALHSARTRIILIQAWTRGAIASAVAKQKQEEILAATKVQSAWRNYKARAAFVATRSSIILMQSFARGKLRSVCYNERLALTTRAAILIQSYVRQQSAKKQALQSGEQVSAAVLIQRVWRGCTERKFTATLRTNSSALIMIQSHVRRYHARKNFNAILRCVLILQAQFRKQQLKNRAATSIQNAWRSYRAWKQNQVLIRAVVVIQCWARQLCSQRIRSEFVAAAAALSIQSIWRGHLGRGVFRRERQSLLDVTEAALKIQKLFRAHLARNAFVTFIRHVLVLQAWGRGLVSRTSLKRQCLAAETIQSMYRGHSIRIQERLRSAAVLRIQSHVRSYLLRRTLALARSSAALIQHQVRRYHMLKLSSIKLIQCVWRGYLVRKLKHTYMMATAFIQSRWRVYSARRRYLVLRSSAITIQCMTRQLLSRGTYSRQLAMIQAVIKIQNRQRQRQSIREKAKLTLYRDGALCIQRIWRGFLGREAATRARHKQRRRERAQRKRMEKAIHVIQLRWRCHRIRSAFKDSVRSAIVLQSWSRRMLSVSKVNRQRDIKLLQSIWRGYAVRKGKETYIQSCVRVQSIWRLYQAHKAYVCKQRSALLLTSIARQFIAKKQFECSRLLKMDEQSKHLAASCIQRAWRLSLGKDSRRDISTIRLQNFARMVVVRRRLLRENNAARCIQVHYFSWRMQQMTMAVENAVVIIQRAFRSHLLRVTTRSLQKEILYQNAAARCIQVHYLTWKMHTTTKRVEQAVLTIQHHWRDNLLRRKASKMQRFATTADEDVSLSAVVIIQRFARRCAEREAAKRNDAILLKQIEKLKPSPLKKKLLYLMGCGDI